ncbi:right-handed parallel beta-helix repeat-containing protein [Saprospiraceae bacterium]|nr:right-handed parallel beta-helix repeat-containing protein [Saprospiraceae bacterium]
MQAKYFATILLFVCLATSGNSTNYYVSNSGNDDNSGLSMDLAFETLQNTVDIVAAGDTVFVENGIFAGFDIRDVNGTSSNPIVYFAIDHNVLIDKKGPIRDDGINIENADYIVIDGFIVNNMLGNGNGIRVVLSDFCEVRNCSCDNNAERGIFTGFTDDILIENNICTNSIDEHGIYVSNSSDRPIVRYNECYGNNGIGIHMNGDLSAGEDGINHDAEIYGNYLHDNNQAAGINLDGVLNPIIYNNIIVNNHSAQGIALFQGDGAIVTSGAKIYNNTIIVPEDGRWGILLKEGANENTEIYNNIIINLHAWRGSIAAENLSGLQCNFNILSNKMSADGDGSAITFSDWQGLGFGSNSLLADSPGSLFVDPDNDNYHLSDNSQAIDVGSDLVSNIVYYDFDLNDRPNGVNYDIGAFEFLHPNITHQENLVDFELFPNPSSGKLYIKAEREIESIILYSLLGDKIQALNREYLNELDLDSGVYMVVVRWKGQEYSNKMLIVQ